MQSATTNDQNSLQQHVETLLYIITIATRIAKTIKKMRSGTIKCDDRSSKGLILECLTESAVLKARCLLDKDKRTVSFENLLGGNRWSLVSKTQYDEFEEGYKDLKIKYKLLIQRLCNNRNVKIAHVQSKEQLGWDEKTCERLNNIFSPSCRFSVVTPENRHITSADFPFEEYVALMADLRLLLIQLR